MRTLLLSTNTVENCGGWSTNTCRGRDGEPSEHGCTDRSEDTYTLTRRLAKITPKKKLVAEVMVLRYITPPHKFLFAGRKKKRAESVHNLAFAGLLHSPQTRYHRWAVRTTTSHGAVRGASSFTGTV